MKGVALTYSLQEVYLAQTEQRVSSAALFLLVPILFAGSVREIGDIKPFSNPATDEKREHSGGGHLETDH